MTLDEALIRSAGECIEGLCSVDPDRRPGSHGNHQAVDYVRGRFEAFGWEVETPSFECLDWYTKGGEVRLESRTVALTPSPYGLGVEAEGVVRVIESSDQITVDLAGSILILTGELASEPLTPKSYPFYSFPEHSEIIEALESVSPAAVIAVTGKYPALCGALDPYPVFEDGDFNIPAASVGPEDGAALMAAEGQKASVAIRSERVPATASNVVGKRGDQGSRVTVVAHIDTKPGTPGAVDNATGVAVLVLLAEMLTDLPTDIGVELLAVNGEDHFAGPGEVAWLADVGERLDDVRLMVNIDGAAYVEGVSAYSTYNLDDDIAALVEETVGQSAGLVSGPEWYQSDHAIFAMQGRPAVAVTSERLEEMLEVLFHADTDTPDRAEPERVVEIAEAIRSLLVAWPT